MHFDLTGEFGGFIFTDTGKRRMTLRIGEEKHLFKVPRTIRRRMIGNFQIGKQIRVVGTVEAGGDAEAPRRVVAQVFPVGVAMIQAVAATCEARPIRVCANKNCWRDGGRELWDTLASELAAGGLSQTVKLKAVNCLDHCKRAPNAEWNGCEYRSCTARDAKLLVEQVAAHLGKSDPVLLPGD